MTSASGVWSGSVHLRKESPLLLQGLIHLTLFSEQVEKANHDKA